MKHLILFLALVATANVAAQKYTARKAVPADTIDQAIVEQVIDNVRQNSCYMAQEVIAVPDADAVTLYQRALQAFSDFSGTGNANTHIDYSDKETATVIYKNVYFLCTIYQFMAGWNMYGDFTIKIRCKNGRAQATVTLSRLTAEQSGRRQVFDIAGVAKSYPTSKPGRQKRASKAFIEIDRAANILLAAIRAKLILPINDDF